MGFFDWIKNIFVGKKNELNGKSGVVSFTTPLTNQFDFTDNKAFNYTYVSCASALAKHAAKMKYVVKNESTQGRNYKYLDRLFNFAPNTLQTAYSMWYSFFYDYYFGGIGIIYIEWDVTAFPMKIKRLWPISPHDVKQTKVYDGELYLQFSLNGEIKVDNIDSFIILVRKPNSEDMLNVSDPSLKVVMGILATNDEGTVKAINNSNAIRFLVSTNTRLNEKMKEDNQAKFDERVKGANQVLYIDGAEHIVQVNSQGKYVETSGVESYKKEILRSFGVNDKFLDSAFNENEWQAIHEGVFEPLQIAIEQELTNKIFSSREFEYGNRIVVEINRLQTASLSTRIKIAEIYEKLPMIVPNVVCDLLYLPHSENGDKEVQSLNFVNANKVDNYQGVGGEDDKDNDNGEGKEEDKDA